MSNLKPNPYLDLSGLSDEAKHKVETLRQSLAEEKKRLAAERAEEERQRLAGLANGTTRWEASDLATYEAREILAAQILNSDDMTAKAILLSSNWFHTIADRLNYIGNQIGDRD